MHPILKTILGSIFGGSRPSTSTPDNLKNVEFVSVYQYILQILLFEVNFDFAPVLGAILAPFGTPKSIRTHPKIDSIRHFNFHRFLCRLGVHFGWIFGTSWAHVGHMLGLVSGPHPPLADAPSRSTPYCCILER